MGGHEEARLVRGMGTGVSRNKRAVTRSLASLSRSVPARGSGWLDKRRNCERFKRAWPGS
jgi:hypothetical protein